MPEGRESYDSNLYGKTTYGDPQLSNPGVNLSYFGWYDFTVKSEHSSDEARYAGHVETGSPSFSDPLMGGMVS